jgi:hypothetical protein
MLRGLQNHRDVNPLQAIMFEIPSHKVRCFLLLRGENFADPPQC